MMLRRLLGVFVAAVLALTLAPALSASAAPASSVPAAAPGAALPASGVLAARRNPAADFPRMPKRCVGDQLIPQKPVRCELNKFRKNRPTVVLWGDSHAWQMIPALRVAARGKKVNLVAFVMGSCPVMDTGLSKQQVRNAPACLRSNFRALQYVRQLKRGKQRVRVLLGTYWQRYLRAIRIGDTRSYHGQMAAQFRTGGPRLFRTLGSMKVGVDVDAQVVTVPGNPPACTAGRTPYSCNLPRKKAIRTEKATKRYLKQKMRRLAGKPRYIDVNQSICRGSTCYSRFQIDGRTVYTYWDDQHISATLSRYLAPYFGPTIKSVRPGSKTQQPPPPPTDGGGDGGGCGLLGLFC